MSEFSDSYHLLGSAQDAVELLTRGKVRGAVLPSEGRWAAIVVRGGDEKKLKAANTGVLLQFFFGADHGCWIRLFEASQKVAEFVASWETGEGSFKPSHWLRLGAADMRSAGVLAALAKAPSYPDFEAPYPAAEALGLGAHEWLSCSDYAMPDSLEGSYPDVIWVPERPEPEDPGLAHMRMFGMEGPDE